MLDTRGIIVKRFLDAEQLGMIQRFYFTSRTMTDELVYLFDDSEGVCRSIPHSDVDSFLNQLGV